MIGRKMILGSACKTRHYVRPEGPAHGSAAQAEGRAQGWVRLEDIEALKVRHSCPPFTVVSHLQRSYPLVT
ncbi:MAG: hypothetical protein ACI8W8_003754 [Rhodothermales bacterium]|jgi:hypothetical protein